MRPREIFVFPGIQFATEAEFNEALWTFFSSTPNPSNPLVDAVTSSKQLIDLIDSVRNRYVDFVLFFVLSGHFANTT